MKMIESSGHLRLGGWCKCDDTTIIRSIIMTKNEENIELLKKLGCLWQYREGEKIHAILTSGKHSDTYVNLSVLNNPKNIRTLLSAFENNEKPDCYCGQAYGSISYAIMAAEIDDVDFIFTEKDKDGNQILKRYSSIVREYNTICMFEDVLTTGGTTLKAIQELKKYKNFNIKIKCIINRSGKDYLKAGSEEIYINSLMTIEAKTWDHFNCELCKNGSMYLPPKENWNIFTQKGTNQ